MRDKWQPKPPPPPSRAGAFAFILVLLLCAAIAVVIFAINPLSPAARLAPLLGTPAPTPLVAPNRVTPKPAVPGQQWQLYFPLIGS